MTDELTPEEKAALENLPRERMPAELEARVVGAMRDHGFLAKRRRMIMVTNSRVAGVLAASVALMIGAYSIGLHRGGGKAMIPSATTLQRDGGYLAETPAELPASKTVAGEKAGEAERPSTEAAEPEPVPVSEMPVDEKMPMAPETAEKAQLEWKLGSSREDAATPAREALSPQGKMNRSSDEASRAPTAAPSVSRQPMTFFLGGSPVLVEAPDSVRVVQDDQGRMLIIYTSDGIIRIRLANDR